MVYISSRDTEERQLEERKRYCIGTDMRGHMVISEGHYPRRDGTVLAEGVEWGEERLMEVEARESHPDEKIIRLTVEKSETWKVKHRGREIDREVLIRLGDIDTQQKVHLEKESGKYKVTVTVKFHFNEGFSAETPDKAEGGVLREIAEKDPDFFEEMMDSIIEERTKEKQRLDELDIENRGTVNGKPQGVVSQRKTVISNTEYHIIGIKHDQASEKELAKFLETQYGDTVDAVCVESPQESNRMSEYYGSKKYANKIEAKFTDIDVKSWTIEEEDREKVEKWGEEIDTQHDNPIIDYARTDEMMSDRTIAELGEEQLERAEEILGEPIDKDKTFGELMAESQEFRINTIHKSSETGKSHDFNNLRESQMGMEIMEVINSHNVKEALILTGTHHAVPSGVEEALKNLANKYDY